MGMDDDENRWEQILYHLNLLSMNRFNGSFMFHFHNGRVSRGTLKEVNDLARRCIKQEEATCRT